MKSFMKPYLIALFSDLVLEGVNRMFPMPFSIGHTFRYLTQKNSYRPAIGHTFRYGCNVHRHADSST